MPRSHSGVHIPLVLLTLLGLSSLLCKMAVVPKCNTVTCSARCPETTGNPAHGAGPRCSQPQAWAQDPAVWGEPRSLGGGDRDLPSVPTSAAQLWSSVLLRTSTALRLLFLG